MKTTLYIIVIKRCYCRILHPHKYALQIKERRHKNKLIKDDLNSKIMNSRLFHLQGVGCTQYAKNRKHN